MWQPNLFKKRPEGQSERPSGIARGTAESSPETPVGTVRRAPNFAAVGSFRGSTEDGDDGPEAQRQRKGFVVTHG